VAYFYSITKYNNQTSLKNPFTRLKDLFDYKSWHDGYHISFNLEDSLKKNDKM
jgi:hypothetical protein